MESFYCGARIPTETELSTAFESEGHIEGSEMNLDLSAHASGASSTMSESIIQEDLPQSDEKGRAPAGSAASDARRRKVPPAALPIPATLMKRLEQMEQDASILLDRVEAVKRRHPTSDFVSGDKCTNSGCAIVGLVKYLHRIASEAANAARALDQLRSVFPESSLATTSVPEDPAHRAILAKAHLTAECSSLSHLELVMRCLETEQGVVGVCVPVAGEQATKRQNVKSALTQEQSRAAADQLRSARLEIDVISASGLRWIKVRSSSSPTAPIVPNTTLNRKVTDEPLSQADLDYVELMCEYVRRTRTVKFAFCQWPELAVLLLHPPPPRLAEALHHSHVRVASAASHHTSSGSTPDSNFMAHHAPFFPPIPLMPSFICLDTTALIALCSETCYPSDLNTQARLTNLKPYKVLREQIRNEVAQPVVRDGGVLEVALRSYTIWNSLRAFERGIALRLLQPMRGEDATSSLQWRRTFAPVALTLPDPSWCDSVPGRGSQGSTEESAYLCDIDKQREAWERETSAREEQKRPNWVITDVTYHEFRWMIETIAGRSETVRARRLLRNVMIVDTSFLRKLPEPNSTLVAKNHIITFVQCLSSSSKIQERNRIIFACADALRAIILTANKRVINSAREQGIHLWARLHPSRSLTELYMHRESRHEGPTRPPPFRANGEDSHIFST